MNIIAILSGFTSLFFYTVGKQTNTRTVLMYSLLKLKGEKNSANIKPLE